MVKIRLKRMGAKKRPFYRIVVADSRCPRDGRFIETLGYYDPLQDPPVIKLDKEKAEDWIRKGAQPTDIARALLKTQGLLGGVTEKPKPEKKSKKAEAAESEASGETASEEPAANAEEEKSE